MMMRTSESLKRRILGHVAQSVIGITSEEVASELGLYLNTCQNALAQLYQRGWVRREREFKVGATGTTFYRYTRAPESCIGCGLPTTETTLEHSGYCPECHEKLIIYKKNKTGQQRSLLSFLEV